MPEINFDASPDKPEDTINFLKNFFEHSRKSATEKNEEFQRVYKMYKLVQDMQGRDRNRANIVVPKLYSTIETILPVFVDALLGLRPYFPIELKRQESSEIGDIMTSLLDSFLDDPDSNFFDENVKLMKYSLLYGTGFEELTPVYINKKVKEFKPIYSFDPISGQPRIVNQSVVTKNKRLLGLKTKAFLPWNIFRDPVANSIDESRGILKFRGYISKRELLKMAKNNPVGFPKFDPEKLDSEMKDTLKDGWSRKMADAIGTPLPVNDDDVGALMSYESTDRYIDIWNFSTIMRDIGNPYDHGKINLSRIVNSFDPNDADDWYGIGEGKPIENLCNAMNDNYSQLIDHHNMRHQGVIYFDDEAISVDQLVMIGGNRIPVTPMPGKSIEDSVYERPMANLPTDFYNVPAVYNNIIDNTTGVHEITRGEEGRTKTAREAVLNKAAGDSRMKLKIKICEQMGFKDIADKATQIIDQFATPDDVVYRVGVENASKLPSLNPAHIDGGYSYSMKGSSRTQDNIIAQQHAKDIFQLMAGFMTIDQGWLAKFTLEKFGVNDEEMRKAILPDEHALKLQLMMDNGGQPSGRLISNGSVVGGSGGNTPTGRDQNEKLTI